MARRRQSSLLAVDIISRRERIAALRARGNTWATIAKKVGMDERATRRAFHDHCADVGEHAIEGGEHALRDLLAQLDQRIESATAMADKHAARNPSVSIGAARVAIRALATKANVLAHAGVLGEGEGAQWAADRAAFKAFVVTGLDLLAGIENGTVEVAEMRRQFGEALGLVEPAIDALPAGGTLP